MVRLLRARRECVDGPVSLPSGVAKSPYLLFTPFFSVAFYSLYCLFTRPRLVTPSSSSSLQQKSKSSPPKLNYVTPIPLQYPSLALQSLRVFWSAMLVFDPLLWSEIWW
ncbi:hypothetical protein DFP72DRAFT_54679 [Ephemerocybe angulata]|uniref:Squalene epoxidase domain-containing protein n=1 Tax=Ephemerocybe angulata TaxID=980116 RepID=A0A8H6MD31_9AGAR|nr:hypothetical protein DFP72DRAFT_54679 [Tulosesus angulatus]